MREAIEKKLGCTIEECLKRSIDLAYNGAEAEYPNPLLKLSYEERRFVDIVIEEMRQRGEYGAPQMVRPSISP